MVQTIKSLLLSRYAFVGLGIVVLAALVFLVGPMISIGGVTPLESPASRMVVAFLMPTFYFATMMIRQRGSQMINSRVSAALGQGGAGGGVAVARQGAGGAEDGTAAGAQEVQTLGVRFKDALGVLRKRRFSSAKGRRWLYQLPWYVIIGPPGSGKTTAITNSGLSFPLADKFGRTALGGVGGTRNCDWWFTDDAVLIDTAGRYTTQDSDAAQDRAAWLGFLRLLKRYRRRQPLNGVLVAIGISELTSANEEARLDHAARIRQRVGELYKELGVRLPVYMMFTKADLIAGFVEYFDDLGREGREAVWGLTFPFVQPEPEGGQVGQYGAEFDLLVGRLDERLMERVQQEGDIQRRALVFGFPQQVASLKDLTAQFLREAFEPNSFEEPIQLRGVYFVSGTQVGTPLDRVMDAMSRTFGVVHPPQPAFAGNKRSYFLNKLLRDVVFGEAGLVDADTRVARRMKRLRIMIFSAIGLVALGLGGFWVASYLRNEALIGRIEATTADYAAKATSLKLDRVADGDLRAVVPLLDELRTIETGYADKDTAPGWFDFFGLDQRAKLGTETRAAYRHALSSILLPRLILRQEAQLAAHQSDPAFLYPALEVYLMLGRQGPISVDTIKRWMALDWASAYPAPADAPLRDSLARHLDALLEAPFTDIGLDSGLIDQTRAVLRKQPLAQRVYDVIVTSSEATKLPAWRLTDNAGPAAEGVLHLRSGQPLSTGIPGIYTREGFLTVFQPMLPKVADAVVSKAWILDPTKPADVNDPATSEQVQRDATGLYVQEFGLRWDHLINDVAVKPITTVDESLRTLNVLSAPTSPIRLLVVAAAKETSLEPPPAPPSGGGGGGGGSSSAAISGGGGGGSAAGSAGGQSGGETAQAAPAVPDALASLFKTAPSSDSPAGIASNYVSDHFKSLHQLVQVPANSGADAQAPIDGAIADLGTLYQSLTSGSGDAAGPLQRTGQSSGAISRLQAGASSLPDPIKGWVLGISESSSNLSLDDAKDQLASLWNGGPGKLCTQATKGRYPFSRGASDDIPIGDFGRLFAAGGSIDSYFTQNLAPFVDMSQTTWRMRPVGTADIKVDAGALVQFQRAATIRDAMFANGGNTPAISFELSVIDLDAAADNVVIDIDGQRVTYAHGAPVALRMHWPALTATGSASVTFTSTAAAAAAGDVPATITTSGPWAMFRLLDRGSVRRTGTPDRLQARFAAGGHVAVVGLRADSVLSPLDGSVFSQFRCPANL
jgi:type VI secretion system protein ImpL